MRFLSTAFVALSALVALASAQSLNPISYPTSGTVLTPGQTVPIAWLPSDGISTISLVLRSGPSGNLGVAGDIVLETDNDGSYDWVVPDNLPQGTDYAVEIKWVNDDGTTGNNYTPQFTIDSTVAPESTGISSTVITSSPIPSSAIPDNKNATVTGITTTTFTTTIPISSTNDTITTITTKHKGNRTTTDHETSTTSKPTTTKNKGDKNKNTTTASGSDTYESTSTPSASKTGGVPGSGNANAVSSVLALVIAGVWALAL